MNRCHGLDLADGWDALELTCCGHDDDRCPNPATCRFYNELEWIPLCADHYDLWVKYTERNGTSYRPDYSLPKWEAAD